MNSTPQSLPGIQSLYHLDPVIKRAASTLGFSLFAAVGIHWVSQPAPSVVQVEQSPLEIWVLKWGPTVALVVAALALVVLARRYFWVKKVLSEGTTIKGTVDEVTIYEREAEKSENSPAFGGAIIRTYYATIRYSWQGAENKVRLKLPYSPGTFKVAKGGEVDLILLESAPKKPLMRAVYLDPIGIRRR